VNCEPVVIIRGVIRSRTWPNRTGPVWTEDQIRAKARTENRTCLRPVLYRIEPGKPGAGPDRTDLGPVLGMDKAEKWHGLPVPPLFLGARSDRAERHDRATPFCSVHPLFLWGTVSPCWGARPCHPFYSVHRSGPGPDRSAPVRSGPSWSSVRSGLGPSNFRP